MKTLRSSLLAFALLAVCRVTQAQTTIVSYSFENTLTPATGASISALTWNSGGAEGYAAVFSGQGLALSVGGFQSGEYYQLTVNATGYRNITLNSFRSNGTGTAPVNWKIAYSLTGISGTFVDATAYALGSATAAASTTIGGISLPSAANNNPSLVLRFIATSSTRIDGNPAAANGTVRLDNLSLIATAIPEPSTSAAILGVSVLVLLIIRRRRLHRAV